MAKTATQLNTSRPLTLVGTEVVAADAGSGTGGATAGQTGGTTTGAIANLYKGTAGSSVASAATVNLGAATGNTVHITGTTTITSFGTASSGVERKVVFDGALTLTHNATSLILPTAANITTVAGDTALFVSEGSGNWKCHRYNRADGTAVGGVSLVNNSVTYAKIQDVTATQRVIGRNTAGAGDPEEVTLTQLLDWIGSATQGDILYRGASSWSRLPIGSSGQVIGVSSGVPAYVGGEAISEPVSALTNSAGTVAINCALGDYFTLSLTANVTSITFSNLPASGKAQTLMIEIKQDATGSRTATWPSSFKWAGGAAGSLSTAANSVDVLALTTFDQGTTWRATLAKAFA